LEIAVVDGQGGGIGKALVEALRAEFGGKVRITALGTNAIATAAMLRAGADTGATGENAVAVCSAHSDVIVGSLGIIAADSMMGELTPRMAQAIASCGARKVLLPLNRCGLFVAGVSPRPVEQSISDAVETIRSFMG
jgi:prephenate dehydrogenase